MLNRRRLLLSLAVLLAAPLACLAADAPKPVDPGAYKEPVRVACVGDSITYGSGVGDREKNAYPVRLGQMLGDKWNVRNFGVSGATLLKKGDKPYDKQKAYAAALEFKPDIVVIALGTNDTKPQNWKFKDEYVADYKAMIAAFREANPKVLVYACLPVPAYPGRWGINEEGIKGEVIPRVREVAKDTGVALIDLYTALSGKPELFPDTVHPNAKGAELMAAEVCRALTGKAPELAPVGAGAEAK
jgi:lysophospholipase L1-like esterase